MPGGQESLPAYLTGDPDGRLEFDVGKFLVEAGLEDTPDIMKLMGHPFHVRGRDGVRA